MVKNSSLPSRTGKLRRIIKDAKCGQPFQENKVDAQLKTKRERRRSSIIRALAFLKAPVALWLNTATSLSDKLRVLRMCTHDML